MKCKNCNEQITKLMIAQGRCPSCGTAVGKPVLQGIPIVVWLFSVVMLFGGVLISAAGVSGTYIYNRDKVHFAYIDAQIVEIQKEIGKDDEVDYTVYVSYTYDSVAVEHVKLINHNSSMKEGDIVQIEIDTRDPSKIVEDPLWMAFIGVVMLAVAVLAFYFVGIRPNLRGTGPTQTRSRFRNR